LTYADSGLVVSIYRPTEQLSLVARREIRRAPGPIFLSPLSLLEIRNAFNLSIQRGEIRETEREAVMTDITRQMDGGFFQLAEVSQRDIYALAHELSNRHTPILSTRSLDLMHVATALLVKATVFLTTDARQGKAAKAEGLKVRPRNPA